MASLLTVPTGSYPLSDSVSDVSGLKEHYQTLEGTLQTLEGALQALKILPDTPNAQQSREERHHKKQAELEPAVRNIEKSLSCRVVSPVTDPSESYPFLGPASPMAPLPQPLPEDHSSYAWQSTLLNHAEDCPDPQRGREDYQTCKAAEKSAKFKAKRCRTPEINGQALKELSDCPVAQRRRQYKLLRKGSGLNLPFQNIKKDSEHYTARRARRYKLLRMRKEEAEAGKGRPTESEMEVDEAKSSIQPPTTNALTTSNRQFLAG